MYYLNSRYYDANTGRFINADIAIAQVGNVHGYNLFSYCFNNPVNSVDTTGNWPQWVIDAANWTNNNIVFPVTEVGKKVVKDIGNFNIFNSNAEKVYESNYFSCYRGTLVLRHYIDILAPFSIGQIIFLDDSYDTTNSSQADRTNLLNHEYGHILQERRYGTSTYLSIIFVPSSIYNYLARGNPVLDKNYYNMPWEYDADVRGGVNRAHSSWAESMSESYFDYWGDLLW